MQYMMCLLASGLAKVFPVQLLHGWILVGLPDRLCRVIVVQRPGADRLHVLEIAHIQRVPAADRLR